jgi:DNA (cytosine-5)-methyltransferase 1
MILRRQSSGFAPLESAPHNLSNGLDRTVDMEDSVLKMATQKSVISLFSGAMGLDLGLEAAGLVTVVAVEKNKTAVATIKLNRGELPIISRPIENVRACEILKLAGLRKGEAFVLTGGPCCQSFSTAGKRQSLGDVKRGLLFRDFKRIVSETRPRFFVMENVKGMLSAAVRHRPLKERGPGFPPLSHEEEFGSALNVICEELAELNYHVIFGLVNCADYGVPQKRYRLVFIGSRDGEGVFIPRPTHSEKNGNPRWVTLGDALGKFTEQKPEFVPFPNDRRKLLKLLKAGQNWRDLPKRLHRVALGAAADSWGGRSGFCRRLSWNEPAPTLTTDPGGRATMLCHPTKLRPLSSREYAELQQFPNDWEFAGSIQQKYVQIGNAVPIGLGKAIGRMLLSVARRSDKYGLPKKFKERLGKVICADHDLARRLRTRQKTRLNPPRMRKNQDSGAAHRWMQQVAA